MNILYDLHEAVNECKGSELNTLIRLSWNYNRSKIIIVSRMRGKGEGIMENKEEGGREGER